MECLDPFRCRYCKTKFKTNRSLTQHLTKSTECSRKVDAVSAANEYSHFFINFDFAARLDSNKRQKIGNVTTKTSTTTTNDSADLQENTNNQHHNNDNNNNNDDNNGIWLYDDDDEDIEDDQQEEEQFDFFPGDIDEEFDDEDSQYQGDFNTEALEDWKKYVDYATKEFDTFPPEMKTAIKLMSVLRQTKASLDTYDYVMQWQLRESGVIGENESFADSPYFVSRKTFFRKLRIRYNMPPEFSSIPKKVLLPHSRARPQVIVNDAKYVLQHMLSDPRIRDEDYLFWNGNPFSPPPDCLDYIADLNTGEAYTKTWRKLIKKPGKQILCPVIFYMDGAVTGQFNNLPITAVRITPGIFTRKARNRDWMWGTLGYVPHVSREKSRGRRLFRDSGHADSLQANPHLNQGEGHIEKEVHQSQDLHAMLKVLLESYIKLQNEGMVWDLFYNGKWYRNVEFVFFTPFFKVDTDEADKLTAHYCGRGKNIKNICRYCTIPTNETNKHLAKYPYKTVTKIQRLIDREDTEALKEISQQNIQNAMYAIRFGQHNDRGIHGACPMEMLHALHLGMFSYVKDMFFEQVGGDQSGFAKEINSLTAQTGKFLGNLS